MESIYFAFYLWFAIDAAILICIGSQKEIDSDLRFRVVVLLVRNTLISFRQLLSDWIEMITKKNYVD